MTFNPYPPELTDAQKFEVFHLACLNLGKRIDALKKAQEQSEKEFKRLSDKVDRLMRRITKFDSE